MQIDVIEKTLSTSTGKGLCSVTFDIYCHDTSASHAVRVIPPEFAFSVLKKIWLEKVFLLEKRMILLASQLKHV